MINSEDVVRNILNSFNELEVMGIIQELEQGNKHNGEMHRLYSELSARGVETFKLDEFKNWSLDTFVKRTARVGMMVLLEEEE